MTTPLVSVCMITYNHEPFLEQALEGVLAQKTDFPIEIVVGEDCSRDNTLSILRQRQSEHPDLISIVTSANNVGINANLNRTVQACRGKYLAFCEGDDYWTDLGKLQKQVDFLEENPAYAASAHQSWIVYDSGDRERRPFRLGVPPVLRLADLLEERPFHTASLLLRTEILQRNLMPANITSCDRTIFLLCASYGPIRYLEEPMCVYRKSPVGISSWIGYDVIKKDLNMVPWLSTLCPGFPRFRALSFIHKTIATYPRDLTRSLKFRHSLLFVFYSFSCFPRNLVQISKILFRRCGRLAGAVNG